MSSIINRKLTLAVVAGKATAWFEKLMAIPGENKVLPLANIIGQATGFEAGATEYGEFIKFRGQFRGTNLTTGETMDAPAVILPAHLGTVLRSALEGKTIDVRSVDFAFGISARYDATAATKYVYDCRSLLAPAASDPLAALESQVKASLALEAPKDDKNVVDASIKADGIEKALADTKAANKKR